MASATRTPKLHRHPPTPLQRRASHRPAPRASSSRAFRKGCQRQSVCGAKVIGQVLHRMNGRSRQHPGGSVVDAETGWEGEELTIAVAEVQKHRVEPSAAGERDRPQDCFRILLVADSAREHDEELVGGNSGAGANAPFTRVGRPECSTSTP